MAFNDDTRSQLLLSLLSCGVVLVLYGVTRWRGGSVAAEEVERSARAARTEPAQRVLVLANRTLTGDELHDALRAASPGSESGRVLRRACPANPVDTGAGRRARARRSSGRRPTTAAQRRLEQTLAILRDRGLTVDGELGDYRPLVALEQAMRSFEPDHVVISTQPDDRSTWLRHDVVTRARERLDVPVHHVVVHEPDPPR